MIVAMDLGGTHCRVGVFANADGHLSLQQVARFSTRSAPSLSRLLRDQATPELRQALKTCAAAVFAVAGPVTCRQIPLPNLPWDIDLDEVQQALGLRRLEAINDFRAQALAWLTPVRDTAETVWAGVPCPQHPVAVVGAGTGFGKALLLSESLGLPATDRVLATEGGHGLYTVESEDDWHFQQHLQQQLGHPPRWDDTVSGPGLKALATYMTGTTPDDAALGPLLQRQPALAARFASAYGRVCRDFVLNTLALDGLVICGGIAAKNPDLIRSSAFRQAFLATPAHSALLARVPIHLVTDTDSGLWGAACQAQALPA